MLARTLLLVMVSALGQFAHAQEPDRDYTALAQPNYANRLALTAEQRAAVANILDERVQALVESEPDERDEIIAESNRRLGALLTDDQKQTFAAMAGDGKLQFDFSQTKWPDVLDWFARQAELALVMDKAPDGTFTYRDARQYSPTEAIDLLNSVLLSKGFTLMRRERMLIVVDVSEGIPFELTPTVAVEDLARRGRFEIVTVEFPLEGRPVSTCVDAVKELIGEHGRVTPLATAGKLLVTETAGKLQAINVVISSIPRPKPAAPKPKPPQPVFAVYPATGLDPATTVETLRELFKDASISGDPKAEEIQAYAIPDVQNAIKASLEKMVANASGDNQPRLEAYPLHSDELSQVQNQLELAVPDAQFTVDESQRRILVVGDAQQQTKVIQALQKLGLTGGDPSDGDRPTIVVYQVDDASTDELADLLRQILPSASLVAQPGRIALRGRTAQQELARTAIDQFRRSEESKVRPILKFYPIQRRLSAELLSTLKATVPDATLTVTEDGTRLAALAVPADHDRVAANLQQIDDPPAERSLRIYPITDPQRKRLQLVRQELEADLPNIKLMLDASPGEIAVWATEDQHTRFAQMLNGLISEMQERDVTVHRLPIHVASPQQLLSLLKERFPQTQFQLDEADNALLIWDTAQRISAIKEEFDKLTAVLPRREETTLETYAVPAADAATILDAAKQIVPTAESRLDSANRRLIVVGSPREQSLVADLLKKLIPTNDLSTDVLISYELQHADPEAVAPMLAELRPDLRFAADRRARRVLVTAPLREQPRMQAIIQQLDKPRNGNADELLRSYQLKQVNPAIIVELLQPLVPGMRLTVDEDAKRLIASGMEIDHQKLAHVIGRIDRGDERTGEVRSYSVGKSDPEQVRDVLMQLVPSAVVSANADAARLLVWAEDEQHTVIKQAIDQFTGHAAQQLRQLRTYELPNQIGPSALALIQSIVPDSATSLDASGKVLICWAIEEQHQLVKKAVEGLRNGDTRRQVKIYSLEELDATLAKQLISAETTDALVLEGSAADQVYVQATAQDHETIESILKNLSAANDGQARRVLQTHDVREDVADHVRRYLGQAIDGFEQINHTASDKIVGWATPALHLRIEQLIDQFEAELQRAEPRVLEVYRLRSVSTAAVRAVLDESYQHLTFLDQNDNSRLLCLATAAQHEQIRDTVKRLEDAAAAVPSQLKVYSIEREKITAQKVADSMDAALTEAVSIQVNDETNSLIVRATEEDHARTQAAIDELVAQLPSAIKLESRVYQLRHADPSDAARMLADLLPRVSWAVNDQARTLAATASSTEHERIKQVLDQMDQARTLKMYPLQTADPENVEDAIEPMIPTASVVGDVEMGALLVSGTDADHQAVASVIEKLDTGSNRRPVMRAYPIQHGDADQIYESVSRAFRNSDDLTITYQRALNTIFVVARPTNHRIFAEIISKLDQSTPASEQRYAQVYTISNVDGAAATAALDTLFENRRPEVHVEYNEPANSLVVVGSESQHREVAEALQQMEGSRRELEVFELQDTDPLVVETAVRELFSQIPESASPSITSDYQSQKIFVRGTPTQIDQIRQLLVRMGESLLASGSPQSGGVRTIAFGGDTLEAVRQIERIWPRVGANRIEVITPSENGLAPRSHVPDLGSPRNGDSPSDDHDGSDQRANDEENTEQGASFNNDLRTYYVSQPADHSAVSDEATEPPVIIVPQPGRITIASPDHAALDQIETLLRAMANSGARGKTGYFAVYMLKNTGAVETQQLLDELIKRLPLTRGGIGDIVAVADERLNALIVYGSQKDRQVVEELLRVLDVNERPNPLIVHQPQLIALKHTRASRVLEILRGVYSTQLTSGGGRKRVDIPEGVSSEVASVLEQINAAAAGPLLTLQIDEASNAIVMRAPPELANEIRALVQNLDDQARAGPARRIRVIRLESSKSDQVKQILDRFLLQPSDG